MKAISIDVIIQTTYLKSSTNDNNIHRLDCVVFRHIHKSRAEQGRKEYDTVRCAFQEGNAVYEGTSKLHIQISVLNVQIVEGYFLPRPLEKYNPYLKKNFIKSTGNHY